MAIGLLALTVGVAARTPASAGTFTAESRQDLELVEAKVRASQFLSRATFGANQAEIDALAGEIVAHGPRAAFEAWIDHQFALPATLHHPAAEDMIDADGWPDFVTDGMSTRVYRHYAWWDTAITAEDQLRQRMAWALAQIFVINGFDGTFNSRSLDDSGAPRYLGVVNYYDMLVENAFGNYRDTLHDVTYHPVMGIFLSHLGNKKADETEGTYPDENYAREAQQLLSIGLYLTKNNGDYELDKHKDPVASYDNDDIVTFARVFTGLYYPRNAEGNYRLNFHVPMAMIESWHDTGAKELHNGTVLPEGQSGDQDISDALDNLFEHPNTGPFIARLLIQRFVKSNPTSRYIGAVASAFADNGAGERGDFKAVIKEILLNDEALNSYSFSTSRKNLTLQVEGGGTETSRLQEPVLRYAAFLRAFDGQASLDPNYGGPAPFPYLPIGDMSSSLNQEAYRSPSVFNFYLPDHVPGGELQDYRPKGRVPNRTVYAPEFQILTAVAINRIANRFRADVRDAKFDTSVRIYDPGNPDYTNPYHNVGVDVLFDFSREETLAADPAALLEHLDILLCHGSMSDAARNGLEATLTASSGSDAEKARGAILALLTAPDCAVHE